jgi:hypothetical protein
MILVLVNPYYNWLHVLYQGLKDKALNLKLSKGPKQVGVYFKLGAWVIPKVLARFGGYFFILLSGSKCDEGRYVQGQPLRLFLGDK